MTPANAVAYHFAAGNASLARGLTKIFDDGGG